MPNFAKKLSLVAAVFAAGSASPALAQQAAPAFESADHLVVPPPKPGHERPLVVIVADSGGAETTDFVIPYAVLKESGVAEVRSLSTKPGPLQLVNTLKIEPDATTTRFDSERPEGSDIVIVPAQMSPKSPALSAWLKSQAAHGAVIMSICEGARVLANADLLHGRRAASHWNSLKELGRAYRDTTWVRDQRYVQDGPVISTTGVSASIPASLALVEAIGGTAAARSTAERLGVSDWSTTHHTADFKLMTGDYTNAIVSLAAVWNHQTLETPIADGVDELSLALSTDAWRRSFRAKVVTTNAGKTAVTGRHGLRILPDAEPRRNGRQMPGMSGPVDSELVRLLAEMRRRYGASAERLARMGLEYDTPRNQLAVEP